MPKKTKGENASEKNQNIKTGKDSARTGKGFSKSTNWEAPSQRSGKKEFFFGSKRQSDKTDKERSDFKAQRSRRPESDNDRSDFKPQRSRRSSSDNERSDFKAQRSRRSESEKPRSRTAKPGRESSLPETPEFAKVPKAKFTRKGKSERVTLEQQDGRIRLNKYIANAGICSRREADDLIKSGVVKVNGKIITEMGYRVNPDDQVQYGDQTLSKESKQYLLLNKPKDYITTADDPEGRKTVMDLVRNACKERLYPVGRLDRNTTGILLMTNDGELAKKLTHPSHQVRKVYQVTLDKNLKAVDLKRIAEGLTLEDGLIEVDEIDWIGEGASKSEVGVVLHSGKNRIVRRIFEHLGYSVVRLDRTYFAGLTKKNLPRGKFRFLTEKEINLLKMS